MKLVRLLTFGTKTMKQREILNKCGDRRGMHMLGRKLPPETIAKMKLNCGKALIGRKLSVEQRKKISDTLKKHPVRYWLGKKRAMNWLTPFKKGQMAWNKGMPASWASGEKNHSWKGGITPLNETIRKSIEYKLWREAVFKRDDYTCQICFRRGSQDVQADHIKPFAFFPELRFAIDNGRTLCKACHRKTDT